MLQNLFSFKKNSNLLIIFLFCFSLFKSLVKLLSLLFLSRISTMPELPEVEAARQTAEEYLVNKTIVEANAVEDESAFFFFFFGLIEIDGQRRWRRRRNLRHSTSPLLFPFFSFHPPHRNLRWRLSRVLALRSRRQDGHRGSQARQKPLAGAGTRRRGRRWW